MKKLAGKAYHYTGRNWMDHNVIVFVNGKFFEMVSASHLGLDYKLGVRLSTTANLQSEGGKPFSTSKSNTRIKYVDGEMHFADKPWVTTLLSGDYSKNVDLEHYTHHKDAVAGHKKWVDNIIKEKTPNIDLHSFLQDVGWRNHYLKENKDDTH